MLPELRLIFAIALVISWTCGTILNSSILAVYLSAWKKGLDLGACNQIILTMACTNLLLQNILTFHLIFLIYRLYILFAKEIFLAAASFIFNFSISLSFWLTAWLTSYYCVRLVDFSNRFFFRLKTGISSVVTYWLLGTVVTLFIIQVPLIWKLEIRTYQNRTTIYNNVNKNFELMLCNAIFACFLPTSITSFCIGLSLMSLLRHVWRMKQNTSEFWNPQLKSHIKACRTMILLLTVNVIFFLAIFISSLKLEYTRQYISWFIMLSIPSGQAIILLFGNSRLATVWSKVLCFQKLGHMNDIGPTLE
ncbi:taste receptor type 2 member 4 [Xenopus laevis]|uniref:Taste receptor type 2 n=1 Tax=Xenopus laevis TaxID=8355 RepID=A0A8J0TYD9_XENLA|nr:taste receptor type 2 member 4 [Xenopus laevis]